MKNILKVLGITVLAVVIGFSLIACPDGGGGKKGEEEDEGFVNNLGSITIDLVDNFQYGEGYQAVYTAATLFKGKQVKEGDEYTLQITFKASRDLTDLLYVGLVDPSPEANYWKKLTAEGEDDGELIAGAEDDKIILKDEEVSVTIKMTAIASSTGATAAKNALVFQTKSDDGVEGTANSGTLGKITLTFSEFIFAKGEIDEVPEPPPPPPPPPALPEGVTLVDDDDISYAENRAVLDLGPSFIAAGELPKYLLLSVGPDGDGLAGTTVIFNSDDGWKQTDSSPSWSYDGAWAAPAKVFIFDLSLCDGYDALPVGNWLQFMIYIGNGANTKIAEDRITGFATVDANTAGATAVAALCVAGNKVTGSNVLWFVDADSIEALFD